MPGGGGGRWGVEWGLQLLGPAGSGLRAVVLMSGSTGSYFLEFAFPGGFELALLPQVVIVARRRTLAAPSHATRAHARTHARMRTNKH